MSRYTIELAKSSGFCFGVDHAVKTAYKVLNENAGKRDIYMLGEITHNELVVNDLLAKGMKLVHSCDEIIPGSIVVIRAHGVKPAILDALAARDCEIYNCTCPFVSKIHNIVRDADEKGQKIYITGTKGHPEVDGICGEAKSDVCVISSEEEARALHFVDANSILVSQTTFSANEFQKIREIIKK